MKREIISIALGIVLIIIGVFSLAYYQSLSLPVRPSLLSALASATPSSATPSWPKSISIPKSGIYALITLGGYKGNKWILADDYVLYLPTSGKLGEGKNTILYAHNRKGLFGNLKKAKIGDLIILGDANGKMYNYIVYSIEYVKPYQVDKIETNVKDTVTLFTCDGWFDEKRLVVKAKII